MSTKAAPWIKKVAEAIEPLNLIPLWGIPPAFPWEKVAQRLSETLNLPELKITPSRAEWKEADELLSGFGQEPLVFPLVTTPLSPSFFWAMPREDVTRLSSWTLGEGEKRSFSDSALQAGFYQYVLLEALALVDELRVLEDLSVKLANGELPRKRCYTFDVAIEYRESTIWGRVICPENYRRAFAEHFGSRERFFSSLHGQGHIELPLNLEIGKTRVTKEELQALSVGDFLMIERASYNPETKKGTMLLSLAETPLFQVKTKDETIKILDYAHYYEESPMDEDEFPEDYREDEIEREWEEDLDNEEEFSQSEDEGEENVEPDEESHTAEIEEPTELFSPNKVPLTLNVEVSRIKMSLEKLLELSPGNVLELSVRPEQGVTLTLSGKSVARGELIQVGDVLGIKITEIS